MTKNTKLVVVAGAVLAALALCCGSCLIAGAGADGVSGGSSASLPNGRYECAQLGVSLQNGMVVPTVTPTMAFTVTDGTFTTETGSGTVVLDGNVATFSGSDQDGWRGLVLVGGGDARIAFSGSDRSVPPPSMDSARIIRCELRR